MHSKTLFNAPRGASAKRSVGSTLTSAICAQSLALVFVQLLQEPHEDLAWIGRFCTHIIEIKDGRIVRSRSATPSSAPTTDSELPHEPLATEVVVASPDRLTPFRVPARKEDRILLFDPGDILYATSRDGKTIIRTATDEATSNLTLQELEQRLLGRGFFKSHRAYLVNLQHIKAVIQFTRNRYTLQLNDSQGTMIPLSKQYEKELQELLGY